MFELAVHLLERLVFGISTGGIVHGGYRSACRITSPPDRQSELGDDLEAERVVVVHRPEPVGDAFEAHGVRDQFRWLDFPGRDQLEEFRIPAGGTRLEGNEFDRGFWYPPTVLSEVDPSMDVVNEEVFGPVTPIVTVESVDEAVELANDSRYALSSYVYTEDYQTAMQTADELEYGETYINRTLGEAWQGHHIGWKESGVGGDDGKHGVLKYTKIKSVYHDYS